jgi:hypothetical protein
MIMDFICGTPIISKSDESHFASFVAFEVVTYSTFVDDIAIEVCFLLFQLITPFPNKKI